MKQPGIMFIACDSCGQPITLRRQPDATWTVTARCCAQPSATLGIHMPVKRVVLSDIERN